MLKIVWAMGYWDQDNGPLYLRADALLPGDVSPFESDAALFKECPKRKPIPGMVWLPIVIDSDGIVS